MAKQEEYIISNIKILQAIVEESYKKMKESLESHRTPKKGGAYILKYDSEHRSFKEALKVIIFVGALIEALWHQKTVELKGKSYAKKTDQDIRSVAIKLEKLGIDDQKLLEQIKTYYKARRQIVHEKVHEKSYQNTIYAAQDEADKAVSILEQVINKLS